MVNLLGKFLVNLHNTWRIHVSKYLLG